LVVGITSTKVNWILEVDVRSFFDAVSQSWLIRFLEHRIADRRILRLIQKWLKAGILEDEVVTVSDKGTGQGSVISPLLANIYLHYSLDLWAERWRRREATGDMIIVRYADDVVIGFEHETDARRFLDAMRARLQEFSLSLHPKKTRLIEFGRRAASNRKQRGLGKPETFDSSALPSSAASCAREDSSGEVRRRMRQSIPEQGKWLGQVVKGFYNYHAVPTNWAALGAFRDEITDRWRRTLSRRSDKGALAWARMKQLADDWLPRPQILHPWPNQRFAVAHPRWEPYA
jgi:RNA-directed DNA polymerase